MVAPAVAAAAKRVVDYARARTAAKRAALANIDLPRFQATKSSSKEFPFFLTPSLEPKSGARNAVAGRASSRSLLTRLHHASEVATVVEANEVLGQSYICLLTRSASTGGRGTREMLIG